MAQEPVRRALRQTGMPPYEFPLGDAIARAAAAAPPAPTVIDTISQFLQRNFPAINDARTTVADTVNTGIANGEVGRTLGGVASGVVRYPLAVASDVVARPVNNVLGGVPGFIGGLLGYKGNEAPAAVTAPAKVAAQASVVDDAEKNAMAAAAAKRGLPAGTQGLRLTGNPVDAAMAAGRAAVVEPTAAERLSTVIGDALKGGVTLRELQTLAPLVPALAKPGQSTKNSVLGETAKLSQSIYANEIAQAQELAKTDEAAAQKIVESATAAYFQRNAGLVGFDPTKLALAQKLGQDEEE